jgi:hypothetical protein
VRSAPPPLLEHLLLGLARIWKYISRVILVLEVVQQQLEAARRGADQRAGDRDGRLLDRRVNALSELASARCPSCSSRPLGDVLRLVSVSNPAASGRVVVEVGNTLRRISLTLTANAASRPREVLGW